MFLLSVEIHALTVFAGSVHFEAQLGQIFALCAPLNHGLLYVGISMSGHRVAQIKMDCTIG